MFFSLEFVAVTCCCHDYCNVCHCISIESIETIRSFNIDIDSIDYFLFTILCLCKILIGKNFVFFVLWPRCLDNSTILVKSNEYIDRFQSTCLLAMVRFIRQFANCITFIFVSNVWIICRFLSKIFVHIDSNFRMLFVVFSELSESTSHAINDIIDLSVTLVGFIYFLVCHKIKCRYRRIRFV